MRNRILKFFGPSLKKPSPEEQRKVARSLFGSCPGCGKDLDGHSRWLLASAIIDPKNGIADELTKLIRGRHWEGAAQFQDWKGDRNERQYYVVRCPNLPELSLFAVVSTADMWSDDYVESRELLDSDSSSAILSLVGDRWEPF